MCGVPFHAADNYISRLIAKGYKVAICEQMEEPSAAKGIVRRDVVRVITPGTLVESNLLEEKKNNYIMAISKGKYYGVAVADISTGEMKATDISYGDIENKLIDEIAKFSPTEIVVNSTFYKQTEFWNRLKSRFNVYITCMDEQFFSQEQSKVNLIEQFGVDIINNKSDSVLSASGALIEYLLQTQKVSLFHIKNLDFYKVEDFMIIDYSSRRNLELTETMREKSKKNSLLGVLDRTMTSMGGRLIRKWIEQPLINIKDITNRLLAVSELKDKLMARGELRESLKKVYDIERLIGKIVLGNVNSRDLISLKNSIAQLPQIKVHTKELKEKLNYLNYEKLDTLDDIFELIHKSILDEPPITIKEGGIIKDGFNEEVDKYRTATKEGKRWIIDLENKEREKSGIKNLKISYNRVFGYYIEITKSNYSSVPADYIRRQTLSNCERYITDDLKKIEDTILGAEEKVVDLEYKLFLEIKEKISENANRIKDVALCISEIDVISTLAEVANKEGYCMPKVNADGIISIKDGRHPVVEKMLKDNNFVPNDTYLDLDEDRLSIITGPNMAGKSTYMRQVALIVLMAQMGSFIPAREANIGIVDRIFTRVGASDDLASGQSTFMVEMNEVANILNNATTKSLLILDEIGRGTSTYDGLSIAWSVIEFIADKERLGSRTLFATHYHELTELEGKLIGIKNYCISVEEKGDEVVFLRKIIRGGADESYGIEVAKLAGVPKPVIDRAKELLKELEDADIIKNEKKIKKNIKPIEGQIDFATFVHKSNNQEEVLEELKNLDITMLTPMDALNMFYKLQQKIKKG